MEEVSDEIKLSSFLKVPLNFLKLFQENITRSFSAVVLQEHYKSAYIFLRINGRCTLHSIYLPIKWTKTSFGRFFLLNERPLSILAIKT